jgi:hypothetical protein
VKVKINIMVYNLIKKIFLLEILLLTAAFGCKKKIENFSSAGRVAAIFPDYTNVVIPPNIAPLNFCIREKGSSFQVEIYSKSGDKIVIRQNSPEIKIPVKSWHSLLNQNAGNNLYIDIYVNANKWIKYLSISDSIASEPIESYLAYRSLYNANAYKFWKKIGIYQRNLENFDESPIYLNTSAREGCVNCHSFCKADPQKMSLHFRLAQPGTLIYSDNKLRRLNTKTKYTMSNFVYTSWHPGGKYIAYALNLIYLNFSSSKNVVSELSDKASDIVVYNVNTNVVTTSPKISTKNRENLPTWSPDGKWMYYISAPEAEKDNVASRILGKYSMVRIGFDPDSCKFGDVDTVLSSKQTGMSIVAPVISPDGRYVIFNMIDHGYFTVFDHNSDIYVMDLKTKEYHKMNISSNSNDSYHCWSQTGRWIVFSSKRLDNIYSVPHFAYFDKNGKSYKPFVLPQKDPKYYYTNLRNFNRPELIKGKVDLNPRQVRNLIYSEIQNVQFDTLVDVDALSGATWIKTHQ